MNKRFASLCLLFSGVLISGYLAAEGNIESTIKQSLYRALPKGSVDQVSPSPLNGISEVLVGMNIFYVSNDGKYVLEGKLIDMDTRADLTEARLGKVRRKSMAALDEGTMIVFPAEKPRHTITVFTDIDCGYCRKLHNEIGAYNDLGITVRYLSFPRSGPNTPSYNKAVSVWCSKDRNLAMTNAKAGKELPKKDCDNPVKRHLELGNEMGVRGTPAILTETGTLLPGYMPARKLLTQLEG